MITVQPIRYTSRPAEWHHLAQALGLRPAFPPQADWSEFDGQGVLAIHRAEAGGERDGLTEFHLLTDDLTGVRDRLSAAGVEVQIDVLDDIGELVTIRTPRSGAISVSGGARTTPSDGLAVMPICYATELSGPERVLEAIGLGPRIASNSGGWVDFTADGGGLAALHEGGSPGVELSFEHSGDLNDLSGRLAAAGYRPRLIDEAYARTLRVDSPDGDEVWINSVQDDLHGYTRLNPGR